MGELATNLLYFGDNLTWLREQGRFPEESVDLDLIDGKPVRMPQGARSTTFTRAQRERGEGVQRRLEDG